MAGNSVTTVEESNFESEVLQAGTPVIVDFWAEWCGPCKMIAPVLEEIAAEKNGAVKVAKVNIDENQALADRFQIRAIPTLLYFKNGEVTGQSVGMTSKQEILSKIES